MRYILVNVSPGSLQIDLLSPEIRHNAQSLHRPGPVAALSIARGHSIDILPFFDGNMEKAHAAIKYSRDTLKFLRPNMLIAYVCDDNGKKIDIDAILGGHYVEPIEEPIVPPADDPPADDPPADDPPADDPDTTKPDMGEGAILAAVDQHEAEMTGEANPIITEEVVEEVVEEELFGEENIPDSMVVMKHVGDALEKKLYEAGLTSYAAVAKADSRILDEIVGHKAKDVRKQAKKLAE